MMAAFIRITFTIMPMVDGPSHLIPSLGPAAAVRPVIEGTNGRTVIGPGSADGIFSPLSVHILLIIRGSWVAHCCWARVVERPPWGCAGSSAV